MSSLPSWIPGISSSGAALRRTVTELLNGTSTTTRTNTLFYDGAGRLRAKGTPEGKITYDYDAVSGRLSGMKAYRAAYTVNSGGTETWGGNSAFGPASPTLHPDVNVSYAYD